MYKVTAWYPTWESYCVENEVEALRFAKRWSRHHVGLISVWYQWGRRNFAQGKELL